MRFAAISGLDSFLGAGSRENLTNLDFFMEGDIDRAFLILRTEDPVHWQRSVAPIRTIAGAIIDSVSAHGECDFVNDVPGKLPTAAICNLIGICREHSDLIVRDH